MKSSEFRPSGGVCCGVDGYHCIFSGDNDPSAIGREGLPLTTLERANSRLRRGLMLNRAAMQHRYSPAAVVKFFQDKTSYAGGKMLKVCFDPA